MTEDERERAWGAVHDAIAQIPGWAVGPCSYHGEVALWYVAAIDLRPRGRYAKREAIQATGAPRSPTAKRAIRARRATLWNGPRLRTGRFRSPLVNWGSGGRMGGAPGDRGPQYRRSLDHGPGVR